MDEGLLDVVWHGEVDLSLVVIPIERDSDVSFARPVFCDVVVLRFRTFMRCLASALSFNLIPK